MAQNIGGIVSEVNIKFIDQPDGSVKIDFTFDEVANPDSLAHRTAMEALKHSLKKLKVNEAIASNKDFSSRELGDRFVKKMQTPFWKFW